MLHWLLTKSSTYGRCFPLSLNEHMTSPAPRIENELPVPGIQRRQGVRGSFISCAEFKAIPLWFKRLSTLKI